MSTPAEAAATGAGTAIAPASLDEILPKVELIDADEIPLESPRHCYQPIRLIAVLSHRWRGRIDFYGGGNRFSYYNVKRARSIAADPVCTTTYKEPNSFFVHGVNRFPSWRYWVVWEEGGRYPDRIIELLSPTTRIDRTVNKGQGPGRS